MWIIVSQLLVEFSLLLFIVTSLLNHHIPLQVILIVLSFNIIQYVARLDFKASTIKSTSIQDNIIMAGKLWIRAQIQANECCYLRLNVDTSISIPAVWIRYYGKPCKNTEQIVLLFLVGNLLITLQVNSLVAIITQDF